MFPPFSKQLFYVISKILFACSNSYEEAWELVTPALGIHCLKDILFDFVVLDEKYFESNYFLAIKHLEYICKRIITIWTYNIDMRKLSEETNSRFVRWKMSDIKDSLNGEIKKYEVIQGLINRIILTTKYLSGNYQHYINRLELTNFRKPPMTDAELEFQKELSCFIEQLDSINIASIVITYE